jgi:hypothetical protein
MEYVCAAVVSVLTQTISRIWFKIVGAVPKLMRSLMVNSKTSDL